MLDGGMLLKDGMKLNVPGWPWLWSSLCLLLRGRHSGFKLRWLSLVLESSAPLVRRPVTWHRYWITLSLLILQNWSVHTCRLQGTCGHAVCIMFGLFELGGKKVGNLGLLQSFRSFLNTSFWEKLRKLGLLAWGGQRTDGAMLKVSV